jgi:tellurite resistance protein TehA-like permease
MALLGVLLILLAPIADLGLGLLGVANTTLDETHLEIAGAVAGAVFFAVGLDLLVLGLVRRSRTP